jgi:hypothetical protein
MGCLDKLLSTFVLLSYFHLTRARSKTMYEFAVKDLFQRVKCFCADEAGHPSHRRSQQIVIVVFPIMGLPGAAATTSRIGWRTGCPAEQRSVFAVMTI